MNKIIKEIANKAEFKIDENGFTRYANPEEFCQEFVKLLLEDLVIEIDNPRVGNRCTFTTYDSSVSRCLKLEIANFIKSRYTLEDEE